jgi:hypothetical protein
LASERFLTSQSNSKQPGERLLCRAVLFAPTTP